MPVELFEFQKQFKIGVVLLKLTQLEETGSTGKLLISLGNLSIIFHFRN